MSEEIKLQSNVFWNRGVTGKLIEGKFFQPFRSTEKINLEGMKRLYFKKTDQGYPLPVVPYFGNMTTFIFHERGLYLTISINRIVYAGSSAMPESYRQIAFEDLKNDKVYPLFASSASYITEKVEKQDEETGKIRIVPEQHALPLYRLISDEAQSYLKSLIDLRDKNIKINPKISSLIKLGSRM